MVDYYADAEDTTPYLSHEYSIDGTETLGTLPDGPTKPGALFEQWIIYNGDMTIGEAATSSTIVASNMKLARLATRNGTKVIFVMNDGSEDEIVSQYDREEGTTVGTLPEAPFKEGYVFVKWVNQGKP